MEDPIMKERMERLIAAILAHPQYLRGEEDLKTTAGIVEAAALVLERMVEDKPCG
jgi:hypothetical protein